MVLGQLRWAGHRACSMARGGQTTPGGGSPSARGAGGVTSSMCGRTVVGRVSGAGESRGVVLGVRMRLLIIVIVSVAVCSAGRNFVLTASVMFRTIIGRILIHVDHAWHRARKYGRLGRGFTRRSVAIDRRPVSGVKTAVCRSVVAPVHSHCQTVFRHFFLLFLHVDFSHFGGKDFPGFFKVGVIPCISLHSE